MRPLAWEDAFSSNKWLSNQGSHGLETLAMETWCNNGVSPVGKSCITAFARDVVEYRGLQMHCPASPFRAFLRNSAKRCALCDKACAERAGRTPRSQTFDFLGCHPSQSKDCGAATLATSAWLRAHAASSAGWPDGPPPAGTVPRGGAERSTRCSVRSPGARAPRPASCASRVKEAGSHMWTKAKLTPTQHIWYCCSTSYCSYSRYTKDGNESIKKGGQKTRKRIKKNPKSIWFFLFLLASWTWMMVHHAKPSFFVTKHAWFFFWIFKTLLYHSNYHPFSVTRLAVQ